MSNSGFISFEYIDFLGNIYTEKLTQKEFTLRVLTDNQKPKGQQMHKIQLKGVY